MRSRLVGRAIPKRSSRRVGINRDTPAVMMPAVASVVGPRIDEVRRSVEAERSVLEAKSRDELQAIAESLGAKPTSRSRKAQIIDMILDVAGGGSGSGSAEATDDDRGSGDDAEANGAQRGSRSGSSDQGKGSDADDDAGDTDDDSDDSDDSDGGGDDEEDGAAGKDRGDGDRSDSRSGRSRIRKAGEPKKGDSAQGGDSDKGEKSEKSDKGGEDSSRGRNRRGNNNRDNRNDNNRGDNNGGNRDGGGKNRDGSGGDDVEPGNRRRRRRRERGGGNEEAFTGDPTPVSGVLDLRDEGYGFLRVDGFLPSAGDCYVSVKQVRQFGLRRGDQLVGGSRPASRNEKNPALVEIESINGQEPGELKDRPKFADLTPLFPDEPLKLERSGGPVDDMTARIIDILAPIGKGQRGMIVSPPKAGKTTIMKQIARSIEVNNPEVELMVLLVDERPEEVTDMTRHVESATVAASTFDRPPEEHTQVAELVLERAKRLVEGGADVVIILDGITRLARAYNLAASGTGRLLSGGVDAGALYPPKQFFGAARNLEEGGSLTILATALVETGSRMDEVIFEEFKGTGNMELRLDRRMAEKRLFPAIDLLGSSTRHDELLQSPKELAAVSKLRKVLDGLNEGDGPAAGLDMLIERLGAQKTNTAFLDDVAKA